MAYVFLFGRFSGQKHVSSQIKCKLLRS